MRFLEMVCRHGRELEESPQVMPSGGARGEGEPLHGITLETIVTELVARYGWKQLGERIKIRCFTSEPSVSSSLKFLRRTPWARAKVEALYLLGRKDDAG